MQFRAEQEKLAAARANRIEERTKAELESLPTYTLADLNSAIEKLREAARTWRGVRGDANKRLRPFEEQLPARAFGLALQQALYVFLTDAELAAISTNMEKDLEKVKRQYHKREKALQKARAEKLKSSDVD